MSHTYQDGHGRCTLCGDHSLGRKQREAAAHKVDDAWVHEEIEEMRFSDDGAYGDGCWVDNEPWCTGRECDFCDPTIHEWMEWLREQERYPDESLHVPLVEAARVR